MLEMTLKTDFTPGTNRKDDMVTADWRFLLPGLGLKRVVCVGAPPISTVKVLASMGAEVIVLGSRARKLADVKKEIVANRLSGVGVFPLNGKLHTEITDHLFDLLLITGRTHLQRLLAKPAHFNHLLELLVPQTGCVFFAVKTPLDAGLYRQTLKLLAQKGFPCVHTFRIAPGLGYIRAAVALQDAPTARFFVKNMVYSKSIKNKALKAVSRLLGSYPRVAVARQSPGQSPSYLPDFLKGIAAANQIDLSGHPWGLSAGGKHNAKKILYFFFDPNTRRTEIIAKMTRDPAFNYRLENEHRVLQYLADHQLAPAGTVPEPLFFGYENGLAVLGQRAIPGKSFRAQTQATAECPLLHQAIAWITGLGAASHAGKKASSQEIKDILLNLFEKFRNIYHISSVHTRYLRKKIDQFAEATGYLPLVFQHGDPGSWNMLVTDDQKVAVIDWEAGEPHGLPLWDLFYFIKTYGTLVARKLHGDIDSTGAFQKNFLSKTAIGDVLIEATRRYCQQINLDTRQVEALFLTCWMHRSLKEAMRLPKKQLDKGHYVNTLRIAIDHRNEGTLHHLFHLE